MWQRGNAVAALCHPRADVAVRVRQPAQPAHLQPILFRWQHFCRISQGQGHIQHRLRLLANSRGKFALSFSNNPLQCRELITINYSHTWLLYLPCYQ